MDSRIPETDKHRGNADGRNAAPQTFTRRIDCAPPLLRPDPAAAAPHNGHGSGARAPGEAA